MRTVERLLAISDIHGQNTKLSLLLSEAQYDPSADLLIICGDMIDRGTENLATITACQDLIKQGAIVLMGNHEQMACQCIRDILDYPHAEKMTDALFHWTQYNGGNNFYHELQMLAKQKLQEIYDFFQSLPQYFTCGNYIFSHAGANVTKPLNENSIDELTWMDKAFPFSPGYPDKIMVFGHVPTFRLTERADKSQTKIWYDATYRDKIGIDCGSVMGGRLAALELPTYREFYV